MCVWLFDTCLPVRLSVHLSVCLFTCVSVSFSLAYGHRTLLALSSVSLFASRWLTFCLAWMPDELSPAHNIFGREVLDILSRIVSLITSGYTLSAPRLKVHKEKEHVRRAAAAGVGTWADQRCRGRLSAAGGERRRNGSSPGAESAAHRAANGGGGGDRRCVWGNRDGVRRQNGADRAVTAGDLPPEEAARRRDEARTPAAQSWSVPRGAAHRLTLASISSANTNWSN